MSSASQLVISAQLCELCSTLGYVDDISSFMTLAVCLYYHIPCNELLPSSPELFERRLYKARCSWYNPCICIRRAGAIPTHEGRVCLRSVRSKFLLVRACTNKIRSLI